MSGFHFFRLFWPAFFVVGVLFYSLIQWGRHKSLGGTAAVFIGPGSFRELSVFSPEQQKRLLREADKNAFSGWRFFIPAIINAFLFSGVAAIALAFDSILAGFAFAMVFYGLAGWLLCRWEAWMIRPWLEDPIERTRVVA